MHELEVDVVVIGAGVAGLAAANVLRTEGREVVEMLAELPDLWDVNISDPANDSGSSRFFPEGSQERYTHWVKSVTSKPVVGVGRFTSPDVMAAQVRRGVLDLIGGRIYLDCSRAPGMFWEGYPFRYDPVALAAAPDAGQNPPDAPCGTPAEMRRAARRLAGIGATLDALAPEAAAVFRERDAPAFRAWVAAEAAVDLAALDRAALLARFDARAARTLDDFAPRSLLPGFVLGHVLQRLAAEVALYDWNRDAVAVARDLAIGEQPDATLRANAGLHALAGGRLTLEEWLAEHGHRGPGEFELAAPRWREDPGRVRTLAASLAAGADPLAQHAAQAARAAALLAEVCALCPPAAAARIRRS